VDEYIYRNFVEQKAIRIAKVKRILMESAMDCDLQSSINSLPPAWRGEPNEAGERFMIPQTRNQDNKELKLTLTEMSAPTFEEGSYQIRCIINPSEEDPEHERPLSAVLDVKDEILDRISALFKKKPIWKHADLYSHSSMKQYKQDVVSYTLQSAIDTGFSLKDKNGRVGHIESRDGVFAFSIGESDTMYDRILNEDLGTPAKLTKSDTPQAVERQDDTISVSSKRDFPDYILKTFSSEVLDWYVVDNVLTHAQKIRHLLSLDWTHPPAYAAPLITETSTGKKMYILGSGQVYNDAKEKINPIGPERDAYRAWVKAAKDRFVSKKSDLFASMNNDAIIFNIDNNESEIRRVSRTKVFTGKACTSYKAPTLNLFSEWLVGTGFPEGIKTKKDRCMFLDLLIRQAVLSGKEGLFWLTPEELSIFLEPEHRSDILKRVKD